jgi:dihydroorotase
MVPPDALQSRRHFLQSVAVAAASPVFAVRQASPPKPDLVIAGGRVIDPSQGIDRVADIAVAGGRIAAVGAGLAAGAAEVLDARGKLVSPGLVDIHAHLDAAMLPSHCLSTGVTAIVDAGSCGADNVPGLVAIATSAPNRMRILINLARRGLSDRAELMDLVNVDVAATRRAIEAHRQTIVGIKVRLSRNVVGERALEAIARAHEITVPLALPLMVHVGQTAMALPAILERLRPGDIVTHIYAPPPNGMLDAEGRVLPEVREARRRGVLFDIGNGRNGHITWDVAERAIQQDFLPDTISSDLTAPGRTDRVFDFPTVLSKFLLLGLSVEQVLARATVNAARALKPFAGLGTLRVGAPADVAIFELRQGQFEFVDNANTKRIGTQKLFPFGVVMDGRRVETGQSAGADPARGR